MTMQASSSFKLAFLKQMLRGFRQTAVLCSSKSSSLMSLEDRKEAIKLSADVAMAAARGGATRWARGIIANLAMDEQRRPLLRSILGNDHHHHQYERLLMKVISSSKSSRRRSIEISSWKKIPRSKSIIRRSFRVRSARRKTKSSTTSSSSSSAAIRNSSSILARSLVRKRTQVLKKLVPGGESMDSFSLLDETLDYVISLRTQADLMRRLLKASSENKTSSSSSSDQLISDERCTMQVRRASIIGKL